MLIKPEHWDELWGADGTRCSYQILIGSDIYTGDDDIEEESLKISRPVFSSRSPIGNTPCFSMECCLRQRETPIQKGSWLELQIRLENSSTQTDWVSLGQFKIYNRHQYKDGWVKFLCRDRMQMSNQLYIKDDSVSEDSWPKSMKEVLKESSERLGLTLDPRSKIQEGPSWVIPIPIGMSIRSVWSSIAAAHGGNFIVTPKQTLLLIHPKAKLVEPDDTGTFLEPDLIGVNFILGKSLLGGQKPPIEAEVSEEGYEILGETARIDRVSLKINDLVFSSGTSGDNDLVVECPYASPEAATHAKSQLDGPLYQPLRASNIVFNPLAEIQDTYLIDGFSLVWSELTTTYGIVPVSNGVAEAMSEPSNEYGFEDTPLNEVRSQIKAVSNSVDKVFEKVDQEQLFNKLTNNGEAQGIYFQDGQIFVNATYMRSGTLLADLIKAGVLQSLNGSFRFNLETGEISIDNYVTTREFENLGGSLEQQGAELSSVKSEVTDLKANSGDLAIRIQKIVDDGVSKVITSMGYSFTDEGMRIKKPGEEIDNKLDHTGMYVFRGSEVMLQANNLGVVATDVSVRNYLIIGDHSRLEDYNDGQDSNRTALFYLS